jgi:hypothetical protein
MMIMTIEVNRRSNNSDNDNDINIPDPPCFFDIPDVLWKTIHETFKDFLLIWQKLKVELKTYCFVTKIYTLEPILHSGYHLMTHHWLTRF